MNATTRTRAITGLHVIGDVGRLGGHQEGRFPGDTDLSALSLVLSS